MNCKKIKKNNEQDLSRNPHSSTTPMKTLYFEFDLDAVWVSRVDSFML